MAEFRLTAAAARDLDDIFDYGAGQWGAGQAASFIATLAERFALLADFPEIGSARDDIEPGVRSTPCGSHIVYFSSDASGVVIERVLHNRRVPHGHI